MNVEFAALLSLAAIVLGVCVGLLWGRARNDGARVEAATARTELQGLRGQLGARRWPLGAWRGSAAAAWLASFP